MKTTEQWLAEVKASPEKLATWLKRQYIGEALAAQRINDLAAAHDGRFKGLLEKVARDEGIHAGWIGGLLTARSIELPVPTIEDTRYWEPIIGHAHSFEDIAAIGFHAEQMRLVRIKAIALDHDIAKDISGVFEKIWKDEAFHVSAFARMTTQEAVERVRPLHEAGMNMLGLEA